MWILAQFRQRLPCSVAQWKVIVEKAIREIRDTLEHDASMKAEDCRYFVETMAEFERQRSEQTEDTSVDYIQAPATEAEFQTWIADYTGRLEHQTLRLHALERWAGSEASSGESSEPL